MRLAERKSQFKRMSYNDGDRAKWEKVLMSELISSDESDVEDGKHVKLIIRRNLNRLAAKQSFVSVEESRQDLCHQIFHYGLLLALIDLELSFQHLVYYLLLSPW